MVKHIPYTIQDKLFWISPERCLFWEEKNTLIVTDVHIGKTGRSGKPAMDNTPGRYKNDLQRLMAQIYLYKADRLIVVGDFIHNTPHKETGAFIKWRKDFSQLHIDLVCGRQDMPENQWYKEVKVHFHPLELWVDNFCFRHEDNRFKKNDIKNKPAYTFSGHLHPGIKIKKQGHPLLIFPCFYFSKECCLLPAFSRNKNKYTVKPEKGEVVYAITGNELLKIG